MRKAVIRDDRLCVRGAYDDRHVLKELPGARWSNDIGAWCYPATPLAVRNVHDIFRGEIELSDSSLALMARGRPVTDILAELADQPTTSIDGSLMAPRRNQYVGRHLIVENDAVYLAYDMGTGKTKTLIDATMMLATGFFAVIVLCPNTVVPVWPYQLSIHTTRSVIVSALPEGSPTKRRVSDASRALERADRERCPCFVVMNYEAAIRPNVAAFLTSIEWDMGALDEAHRCATPSAKVSRFVGERLRPRCRKRVCLSGTPLRGSPLDVYAQCKWLDPALFGTSFRRFRAQYADVDESAGYPRIRRFKNLDDLGQRFALIAHQVKKRDVLDLPPVTHERVYVELPKEAIKPYDDIAEELVTLFDDGETVIAQNALVRLLRLAQITSGHVGVETADGGRSVRIIHDAKSKAFASWLDDFPEDEPLVVFALFTHDLDCIHRVCNAKGRESFELSGRAKGLDQWKASTAGVLATQIAAGAEGVDMTKASTAMFWSIGYSLAKWQQAISRLDRPGQESPVTCAHLVMRKTVDEAKATAIEKSEDLVASALKWLGVAPEHLFAFSDDDIMKGAT